MPKKHRQTYQPKPGSNYVHPSLGGSPRTGENAQAKPVLSVNERLTNLRLAQASPASLERKRQLAELSNQRSLPPSLGQGILGQTAVAAPAPRNSASQRSRVRFRTPGPAPPPSWVSRLTSHRQALENRYYPAKRQPRTFGQNGAPTRNMPQGLARFLNMANDNPVIPGSLLDMSLKVAARNWSDIVEDCGEWLDVIPAHLRVVLLSYLTTLGPPEGIDMAGLHALFPNPSEASSLDLSGLVAWGFTIKELRKWLHQSAEDTKDLAEKSQQQKSDIADSWDQEDSSSDDSDFFIPKPFNNNLQHLTKLSLGHPPSSASWTDLLLLSKDLHTITHLSLAHWPLPTRTPNSTSPYASLDRDFEESALVLRMLAENTYCLRWLDLQGCHSWLPALTHRSYALPLQPTDSEDSDNDWSLQTQRLKGPDWNGAWRHLTYLNISQDPISWFPTNAAFLKTSPFRQKMAKSYFRIGVKHQQIIDDLRDYISTHPEKREYQIQHCGDCHATADLGDCWQECGACDAYQDMFVGLMARWLEREAEARTVARGIIAARQGTGLRCTFDHGWQSRESYPVLNWP
ncbi:hypothetical protein KCU99_g5587, partial [Aureobasidium melanogenum]